MQANNQGPHRQGLQGAHSLRPKPPTVGECCQAVYTMHCNAQVYAVTRKPVWRRTLPSEDLATDLRVVLHQGMCELMDTKGLDEKELARLREEERQLAARQVTVDAVDHRNREFTFSAEYEMIFQTNGGWMVDVNITKDDHTTAHRVIVSKHMVESVDARGPKELVEKAFAVLLGQKDMQRRTEGLISPLTFPINYFTVSEVEQYYPEAFQKMFDKKLPGGFWHFSRVVDYSTPAPISSEDQRLEPSS
eukprot:scaffold1229_cov400-Prasinococcus_capsulatus_cf.AAC.6